MYNGHAILQLLALNALCEGAWLPPGLGGHLPPYGPAPPPPWAVPPTSAVFRRPMDAMVDLTNDLGVAILQEYSHSHSNFAFSPYGLASVLVVLYEGAQGESARQIHVAAKFPWDRDITRIGFRDIHRHLRSYFSHEGYLSGITLNRDRSSLNKEYKRVLRFYGYDVDVEPPKPIGGQKPLAPVPTMSPSPKPHIPQGENSTGILTTTPKDTLNSTNFLSKEPEGKVTEQTIILNVKEVDTTAESTSTNTPDLSLIEVDPETGTTISNSSEDSLSSGYTTEKTSSTSVFPSEVTTEMSTDVPISTSSVSPTKVPTPTSSEVSTEVSYVSSTEVLTPKTPSEVSTDNPSSNFDSPSSEILTPEISSAQPTEVISEVTQASIEEVTSVKTEVVTDGSSLNEGGVLDNGMLVPQPIGPLPGSTTNQIQETNKPTEPTGISAKPETTDLPTIAPATIITDIEKTTTEISSSTNQRESPEDIEPRVNDEDFLETTTLSFQEDVATSADSEESVNIATTGMNDTEQVESKVYDEETISTTPKYSLKDTTITNEEELNGTTVKYEEEPKGTTLIYKEEPNDTTLKYDEKPKVTTVIYEETTLAIEIESKESTLTLEEGPKSTTLATDEEPKLTTLSDGGELNSTTLATEEDVNTTTPASQKATSTETTTTQFSTTETTTNGLLETRSTSEGLPTSGEEKELMKRSPEPWSIRILQESSSNSVVADKAVLQPPSRDFHISVESKGFVPKTLDELLLLRDDPSAVKEEEKEVYLPKTLEEYFHQTSKEWQPSPPIKFNTEVGFKRFSSVRKARTIADMLHIPAVPDLSLQLQNGMFDSHVSRRAELYRPLPRQPFLVDAASEMPVPVMTYTNVFPFAYIPRLHSTALEFPLDDERYKLLLILPVESRGLRQLTYDLSAVTLRGVLDALRPARVRATVPTFMVEGFVILTPALQRLGVWNVFDPRRANLTGMSSDPELYVRNVEQSVTVVIRNYVEILDIQTRTMAARGPEHEFQATHPFLYFVLDSETNVSLMAGQMLDPLNSRVY